MTDEEVTVFGVTVSRERLLKIIRQKLAERDAPPDDPEDDDAFPPAQDDD